MSILLTGASGFVGRQVLTSLLRRGEEVHAVSRTHPHVEGIYEWHEIDLLDDQALLRLMKALRPSCIIHLAWYVDHGKFWSAPENETWKRATLELAGAAAEAGVRRFVATGTCYEYDWPDAEPCDERTTPVAGHTLYDRMKNETRLALEAFCAEKAMSFSWARLFFLFGSHEAPERLVASVARALLRSTPAACSTGRVVRDFMDVRDAGAAIAALALSNVEGPVNIGSGRPLTVAEIVIRLAELSGKPHLLKLGALPDREGEPPFIVAETRRLVEEVGYKTSHELDEGLKDALSFWAEEERRNR
jgi:nucleoside-diphosphate-sugar epimerase